MEKITFKKPLGGLGGKFMDAILNPPMPPKDNQWGLSAKNDLINAANVARNIPIKAAGRIKQTEQDIATVPRFVAAAGLNYLSGGGAEGLRDLTAKQMEDAGKRWGIVNNTLPAVEPNTTVKNVNQDNKIISPIPSETKSTTPSETKSTYFDLNKSHGGDIYAALRDPKAINDRQFKKFVELHGEELPGIGFIEDAKTGKIFRVAEKPESPPGMNVTQANATTNMINAQANAKAAELGLAEKKSQNTEKSEQKNLESFYKIYGRPIYNMEGKQEGYNPELTVWDALHAGAKDRIPESELPILEKVGLKWKDFWDNTLANEKWKNAYKKNKSATERALKDSFRNYLVKSYSSNPE